MAHSQLRERTDLGNLYAHALGSVYRSGIRLPHPDWALEQDPDFYEKLRRDDNVLRAERTMLRKIGGREWGVEPGGDRDVDSEAAKVMEDILRACPRFSEARQMLAMAEITGEEFLLIQSRRKWVHLGGERSQQWLMPVGLKHINRFRFRYGLRPERDGSHVKNAVLLELAQIRPTVEWQPVTPDFRKTLLRHVYWNVEDSLGRGRGIGVGVYFAHFVKTTLYQKMLEGVDRWANGVVDVAINSMREGSTDRSADDVIAEWERVFETHRTQHILFHDEADKLTFHETSGTGHQLVMEAIRYVDEGVQRLFEGNLLPTGGGSDVGSNARAETEAEEATDMLRPSVELLDDTLQEQYVRFFWHHNRAQFAALGLADARMPRFTSFVQRDEFNPERDAGVITQALQAGIPIVEQQAYEKLGLRVPAETDKIVRPIGGGGLFDVDLSDVDLGVPDTLPDDVGGEGDPAGEPVLPGAQAEAPDVQAISLAYERSLKARDRGMFTIMRAKLAEAMGNAAPPPLSDAEWDEMTSGGGVNEDVELP